MSTPLTTFDTGAVLVIDIEPRTVATSTVEQRHQSSNASFKSVLPSQEANRGGRRGEEERQTGSPKSAKSGGLFEDWCRTSSTPILEQAMIVYTTCVWVIGSKIHVKSCDTNLRTRSAVTLRFVRRLVLTTKYAVTHMQEGR